MQTFLVLTLACAALINSSRPATNEVAERWYAGYNETYFENKLPKDTRVQFVRELKDWEGNRVLGLTYSSTPATIQINAEYRDTPPIWLEILLHEQCHLSLDSTPEFDMHGAKFQACMLHLAQAGAFAQLW